MERRTDSRERRGLSFVSPSVGDSSSNDSSCVILVVSKLLSQENFQRLSDLPHPCPDSNLVSSTLIIIGENLYIHAL